jgi:CRP-like cAMP-binding protein
MAAPKEPLEPATNKLLAALPRRDRDRLLRHLKPVVLGFEEVLYEPDGPIRHVYFPTSGVISVLLVLEDGLVAEVGRVGNEGMVGLSLFLGVWTRTRASCKFPARPCA